MNKPKAPCAGVIVFDCTCTSVVLIATHNDVWGFPKGKREKSDVSVVEAALRELREESGLTSCDIRLVSEESIVENSIRGNPATEYFVAVLKHHSHQFQPEDIDEIKCVKLATIPQAKQLLDDRRQKSLQTALLIATTNVKNGSNQHP